MTAIVNLSDATVYQFHGSLIPEAAISDNRYVVIVDKLRFGISARREYFRNEKVAISWAKAQRTTSSVLTVIDAVENEICWDWISPTFRI